MSSNDQSKQSPQTSQRNMLKSNILGQKASIRRIALETAAENLRNMRFRKSIHLNAVEMQKLNCVIDACCFYIGYPIDEMKEIHEASIKLQSIMTSNDMGMPDQWYDENDIYNFHEFERSLKCLINHFDAQVNGTVRENRKNFGLTWEQELLRIGLTVYWQRCLKRRVAVSDNGPYHMFLSELQGNALTTVPLEFQGVRYWAATVWPSADIQQKADQIWKYAQGIYNGAITFPEHVKE